MLTHIDKPIRIGELEIKNRVVRSAHATGLSVGIGDDLIAYHTARARGGVGLTVLEILSVHPSSPAFLNAWLPNAGDGYARLIESVRPYGMRLFQQLWHGGHNALPADGGPSWSASDIPGFQVGVVPIAMTKAMIDTIVESFADAARKCEAWGLDGVELYAVTGYLPQQFLSPNFNRREDDYGGSFENRARFSMEIMRAIRASVPGRFPVGIRVGADLNAGGLGPDDNLRLVQLLQGEGLIDYVSTSLGNYQTVHKMIGGMHEPVGYQMPYSVPITRQIRLPTIVAGRFRTLEEADQIIRNGEADMVAMVRATIADPDLVNKTFAGNVERVRPCIGCNQGCIGNVAGPAHRLGCVVNAAVGYELSVGDDRLTAAATPKTVFVVGGGPAGMEAARVAALSGHRVILAEAESQLGGTVKIAAKAPTRHGVGDITLWMEQEIYRLGVDVRLSTYVDADDVLAENPDKVIVATGSTPRMDGIQLSNPGDPIAGFERRNVISSGELFTNANRSLGRSAVVIDDAGHYEGVAAAEYLVGKGVAVTYVTRHHGFAPLMEPAMMNEPALLRLSQGQFAALYRSRALAIDDDGVIVGPTYLPRETKLARRIPADTIVFISHNRPNRDLYDALVECGANVAVIGDANSPRFLQSAIREGHLAGAAI